MDHLTVNNIRRVLPPGEETEIDQAGVSRLSASAKALFEGINARVNFKKVQFQRAFLPFYATGLLFL